MDAQDDGLGLTPDERWAELKRLQAEYAKFEVFAVDVMVGLLGFEITEVQLDIASYMATGPQYSMVQAQRSQAKTTLAAIYAVWCLIHYPSYRVLIISAGDTQATEISNWIIQIITSMPELRCLRPDAAHGDRTSIKAFDIHWVLKGPEKSPSVASIGITGSMSGKRADLLIPDDIESPKNSQTANQRERLVHLSKEFSSICAHGKILYLGTPQSIDSVYNTLPGRGFDIRIWPGRYPTAEEIDNYGAFLAPMLREALLTDPTLQSGGGLMGDRGKPIDPVMMSEHMLTKKEQDQGLAYFQLQYMLDTKLTDKARFPLNVSNIMFMPLGTDRVPLVLNYLQDAAYRMSVPADFPLSAPLYRVGSYGTEFGTFDGITYMYIDPAGGGANGDETAWAISKFFANKVAIPGIGAEPGGYSEAALDALVAVAVKYKVNKVGIEKNFGNGALCAMLTPKLLKALPTCGIEEMWEGTQKELRIIDILEPVISSHRLVMDPSIVTADLQSIQKYPLEKRVQYSLFHQMAKITRTKGALIHEDRLDALAGAVRYFVSFLKIEEDRAKKQSQLEAYNKLMSDPLGNGIPMPGWERPTRGLTSLDRGKRLWN